MDGDLQNDPADIPRLLEKIDEGYDVVSGWRRIARDGFARRLPSRIANWLIGRVTGVRLHDYGCTLKAYRAEIVARDAAVRRDASLPAGARVPGGRSHHGDPRAAPSADVRPAASTASAARSRSCSTCSR